MALDILIVDDEQDIRDLVSGVLEDEGFTTRTAADSNEALQALSERRPSLALLDVWLQGSKLDGLQLLEEIKRRDPTLPVLIISGHGNLDTAVAEAGQSLDVEDQADQGPAAAGGVVELDAPEMLLDDLLDDCEAQPRPPDARRHIWFRQPLALLGQPYARVQDVDDQMPIVFADL